MKRTTLHNFFIGFFLLILHWGLSAQYTLDQAIIDAKENSAVLKLNSLHQEISQLKVDNISKSYYPKVGLTGQATYQSTVTELPIELPGIEIQGLSKDQYKFQVELKQLIYDGGITQNMKDLVRLSSTLEGLKNEVEFEQIRSMVLANYFLILEIESKVDILNIKKETLQSSLSTLESGVKNGVVIQSELFEIQAALISVDQEIEKIENYRTIVLNSLGLITGKNIDSGLTFELPRNLNQNSFDFNQKPIYNQLNLQKEILLQNQKLSERKSMPVASAFFNGGYGRPALNFLSNTFEPYYIGGVRLSWSLDNLYTKSKERQIVQLNSQLIDERKSIITDNLNHQKIKYEGEIKLNQSLLESDEKILDLRKKIRETGESQLRNGTITSNRLLPLINQENEIMETISLRKLQIIKNQYLLQHLTGNYNN